MSSLVLSTGGTIDKTDTLTEETSMPADYEIDEETKTVFSRAWGKVTDEDALNHQQRLMADSRFNPMFNQLLDATAVVDFEISTNGVQILASRNPWKSGVRRAFVATDDLAFGMFRMHEAYLVENSKEIIVCKSIEEAHKWLGLD